MEETTANNPYAAPATTELLQHEPAWLLPKRPPRPIAIWVMMIVMALFSLGLVIEPIKSLTLVQVGALSPVRWLISAVIVLGFVAGFGVLAVGLWRGRNWGRWLGLALIVLLFFWMLLKQDTTIYANEAERAGGTVATRFMLPALCVWWAYALALSKKARLYFSPAQPPSDR